MRKGGAEACCEFRGQGSSCISFCTHVHAMGNSEHGSVHCTRKGGTLSKIAKRWGMQRMNLGSKEGRGAPNGEVGGNIIHHNRSWWVCSQVETRC